jgi:hypothetical protein
MKELFAESPILLASILGSLAIASFFGWLKHGTRPALVVALLFFLLIPAGLLLERRWVTDREEIRQLIESATKNLEIGDYETVLKMLDPTSGNVLENARGELPRFKFDEARVTSYRSIEINPKMTPPEAIADFSVILAISDDRFLKNQRLPRRLRVAFRKKADGWKVIALEHFPPIGKSDSYSTITQNESMPSWAPRTD